MFQIKLIIKSTSAGLEPTSAAPSAAFFSPQLSAAQRSATFRSLVMKKLSKKMSEVMDQSSSPTALNGVILNGCRSSKNAGLGIFLGFQMPYKTQRVKGQELVRVLWARLLVR